MATLRLFASARVAAGTGRVAIDGATVGEVIDRAIETFRPEFGALVPCCRVWLNGEPAAFDEPVGPGDEVALLPPVSGGATSPSDGSMSSYPLARGDAATSEVT